MRTRFWLTGVLLVGLWIAAWPVRAEAAIWPFSLFGAKKPVKPTKPKPGKPRPGGRPAPSFGR
jgi:hypothetical protein